MKRIRITASPKSVKANVVIPGSKSYTNRALLLAAMTNNPVRILNPLLSDDTQAMIECLQTIGIKIVVNKNSIDVIGSIADVEDKEFILDAHLSGTTIRFLLPLLTIVPGIKILKGKEGLNKRPIKILVDALIQLGAKIEYLYREGFPPLKITSSSLTSGKITLNGSVSSQYFSALLMTAPLIGSITIKTKGTQISKPYIDMTIDSMKKFGVQVRNKKHREYGITHQNYKANEYIVEGDFSSAGYFLGLAAVTKSTITLKNLNPDSLQADRKMLNILHQMGSKIILGKNEITIIGNGIKPLDSNVIDFPDSAQALAVLAAFAKGVTKISGIQSLRIKETNRVIALQKELKKMGIVTSATNKTLTIFGGSPKPATIDTYGDHRMAMAFAIAATKLSGMKINNPDVVTKTFPNFWRELKKVGITIEERNSSRQKIVLIGFMGSGKSSIAPLVAKKLTYVPVEMDDLVLKKSREKSIKEIFDKFGENHFRTLEEQIAVSLEKEKKLVISAGGGVVMNQETIDTLSKNATVIFLSTKFETLRKRLDNNSTRPLWKDLLQAKELLHFRTPLYKNYADIIVPTDNKSLQKITKEIVQRLEEVL